MRMQKRITLSPESTRCSTCMLISLCLPLGINSNDIVKFDEVVSERLRIPKGAALFHQGDPATAIYGIRSGSIKTQLEDAVGQVQVTGFLLPGEVVGIDGLLNTTQLSHAIALEATDECLQSIAAWSRV